MFHRLRNVSIATQLYVSFFVIIALFIAVLLYSNAVINRVNVAHQRMADFVATRSAEVDSFETVFAQFDSTIQSLMLYHEFEIEMHPEIIAHHSEIISGLVHIMQDVTNSYIYLVNADNYISERNRLMGIGTMSAIQMNVQRLYHSVSEAFFFGGEPNWQTFVSIGVYSRVVEENIGRLRPYMYGEADELQTEIITILQDYSIQGFFIVFFVVGLSSFLAWATVKSFVLRISSIEKYVRRIKKGDLSKPAQGSDEISHLINDIIESMANVITSINQVSIESGEGSIALIDVTDFEGGYADALTKVNNLIENMEKHHAASLRTRLAEQNSLAKSRFLAHMSHEIRTPITAVLGISEIQLRNPHLPLPVMEAFAKIFDSANNLQGIINDILDISKIEANKMELVIAQYESTSLISDTVQLHVINLGDKDINFAIDINENMPAYLIGDELRTKQIINNLLSNAIKYTDSGDVKLSLHCERKQYSEVDLIIVVSDTGRGMTQTQIEALTDEYSRFHEQEDPRLIGTGLGMSITQGFISMMGGTLSVESTVGVGTTFRVVIPQVASRKEVIGKECADNLRNYESGALKGRRNEKITYASMSHGRVLVVDDVDANLYVAKELMSFYDLNVETALSGYIAIEKIKEGKTYDIIFMDYMMPDIDGVKTVRIIREMGYTGCIVAFTANAMIGAAEEFMKNGFNSFLPKPIQSAQLDAVLHKFIGANKGTAGKIPKKNRFMEPNSGMLAVVQKKFLSGQRDVMKKLEDAVASNDLQTAVYLTHTLKGLVLLMEVNDVGQMAGQLEAAFNEGTVNTELMQQLGIEIGKLISELEAVHEKA